MNNLPVLRTRLDNRKRRAEVVNCPERGRTPVRESTGQKVIREACDNSLHYELNLNRALARET